MFVLNKIIILTFLEFSELGIIRYTCSSTTANFSKKI